jgi:hypothetical protein
VLWLSTLSLDIDGDGSADSLALGAAEHEVLVVVTLGSRKGDPITFRFPSGGAAQDGVCGDPRRARMVAEEQLAPARREEKASDPNPRSGEVRQGARLESGDCDAFHFVSDGRTVTWWRR